MKITVKRSGGFAGLTETLGAVDTSTLDAGQARDIELRVSDLGFFSLPETIAGSEMGADLFQYEITVLDRGRSHTVQFPDHAENMTNPLRRLVDAVTQTH